jgi:hypothetical protein
MAKTQNTEVVVAQPGALVAPAFMDAADFGMGFEGADKDSYAIPFLQLLQKMSPLVDDDSPKKLEGAKAGMIFNTVTQKLHDVRENPLILIPAAYKRSFILWGARDANGGFKGEVTPEEMQAIIASEKVELVDGRYLVKDDKGEVNVKKSDYYADTRSHYVIAIDPETNEAAPAILSLASSQIKASKMLLTMLQQKKVDVGGGVKRTPPTFANRVKTTTVSQSNEKGTWSGVKFELDGLVTDPDLYQQAKEFHRAISAGEVKADYSKSADDGSTGAGVAGTPQTAEGF